MTKKVVEEPTYQQQTQMNEWVFMNMIKDIRPDLWMLADTMETLGFEQTQTSLMLAKILRQISNLLYGSRWGKIQLDVENGVVTFIRGEESDKIYLNLKKENS